MIVLLFVFGSPLCADESAERFPHPDVNDSIGVNHSPVESCPPFPGSLAKGPIVLFGASSTALRPEVKTFGELLEEKFNLWKWPVQIVNAGVPGNTTELARRRFQRDVLEKKPSLVVIMLGINDASIDVWKEDAASEPRVLLSRYKENLEYFVDAVRAINSEIILMTPHALRWAPAMRKLYGKAPYDLDNELGLNVVLAQYIEALREVAASKHVALVDLYTPFSEITDAEARSLLLKDGMHPNSTGHQLIAELLLKELLKVAPDKL